jgi:hypothetical protein
MVPHLHIALLTATMLMGSVSVASAGASADFSKGYAAFAAGDVAQAAKWLRKAAVQGHAIAQYNLGWMYGNGQGFTQDYAHAVKWYRKAADQGVAAAQYNLGVMYDKGQGVIQDNITAHMWFNIAASKANKFAAIMRDYVAKKMTAATIEEAQKRARLCVKSNYKRCD